MCPGGPGPTGLGQRIMLAVYLHRVDPFVFRVGDIGLRWYGLSYLLGFLVAYWLIRRVVRGGGSWIELKRVGDFVVAVAVGIVVGGRLGYALFYRPETIWTFSGSAPFWELLAINHGGMASHGGIIGAVLGCYWFARRSGGSGSGGRFLHTVDLMAFTAGPGLFLGRMANFINGELYGRAAGADLPWAVRFPQEMYTWSYERLTELVAKLDAIPSARAAMAEDGAYPLPAIIDLIQRNNEAVIRVVEPLLTPRHPSQLYQGLLEGLLLFVILAVAWARPRKPGVVSGLACLCYGVLRIVGEFYREPDSHLGFQWLGLTRGQWLSVVMVAAGVAMLVVFSRRGGERMGGWRDGADSQAV